MVLIESVRNVAPRVGHRKMEKINRSSSSNNNNNNNNDIHKPSEAQLRWAQFHHKTRAREVKGRVERLWHTPLEVKDVDGAHSYDGTSTCSDGSCDYPTQAVLPRRSRPKISRGRRALLKVSQRGYEKRRAFVQEQGFQCSSDKENQIREERDEQEGTKRTAKGSRGLLANADEARKHRFEAAYAMMNNLNPSNKPILVRSTKRWTRPSNAHTADESSGTNYQDWKWGLARRKRTADTHRLPRIANMPFDRRATWLVHMPARESSAASRRFKYRQPVSSEGDFLEPVSMHAGTDSLSPGQLKFDEMVSRLQDYGSAPMPEHGMPSLSARYLNCLPTSEPIQSSRVVRRHRMPFDYSFDEQSKEELPSDIRQQRESIGVRYAREHLQYHEEEVTPHRRSRSGVGDRYEEYLAQQQGRVSEAHSVGTVGSVDSDFFEKARNMHGARPLDDESGPRFPRQPSALQAIPESSNDSTGKGRSDRRVDDSFDQFAPRVQGGYYFGNDSTGMSSDDKSRSGPGRDYAFEHHEQQLSEIPPKSYQESRPWNMRGSVASHTASTSSSDLQTPKTQIREKGALFDFATPCSDFGEDDDKKLADRNVVVSTASSFRMGAVKVAGGIFQMITGTSRSSSDDGSELRAVAAFRETQKERRGHQEGSTSTSSSFHALPEGLRRLVLGPSSSQQEATHRPTYDSGALDLLRREQPPSLQHFNPSAFSSDTPERPIAARSTTNSLSPEHGKLVHQKLMEESMMFGENGISQAIIDTDDTKSDASGSVVDAVTAANLMMSPTILTKRHQQAVKAIERRNWEQITYLLSANPWLAEMMEVTTQQYLLHKVALYGASKFLWSDENDAVDVVQAAPQQLNDDILHMFPSSVHKFDHDGNLPLHMAAASGNIEMTILLGERFSSGASVRNNDGMLPLHLAVQACSTPLANASGEMVYGADFVALILQLFPGAVAVADNEGELPLHIAAAVLEGEVGVDVIYLLLDEADRQAQSDGGLRFIEKVHSKTDDDSVDDTAILTASPTDQLDDDIMHCTMVRNEMGRNALTKAIEAGSGWQVIEGLARGPGGTSAALMQDAQGCNALHLLLSEEYGDPQAALSILKIAPATVTVKNADRMLPVEIACRNEMPEEVILAMVLVDSPVDLSRKDIIKMKDGYGGSWWFLTCESDDQFVELVIEVISICNFEHLRELCFMKGGQDRKGAPVLERATPMCREVLEEALSFGTTTARAPDRLDNK